MVTTNDDNKTFLLELITLYYEFSELWKVKSDVYKNRNKKDVAYEKLFEKMKETDPKTNKDQVHSKINALHTSYRRELKKIKASIKSGAGTENVSEPSLWFFKELDFFRGQETQLQGTSTTNDIEVVNEMNETVSFSCF